MKIKVISFILLISLINDSSFFFFRKSFESFPLLTAFSIMTLLPVSFTMHLAKGYVDKSFIDGIELGLSNREELKELLLDHKKNYFNEYANEGIDPKKFEEKYNLECPLYAKKIKKFSLYGEKKE